MKRGQSVSEGLKQYKKTMSEKFSDWKEDSYGPWKEETYKPWKKEFSKNVKRFNKQFKKMLVRWKRNMLEKYKQWRKNKVKREAGLQIKIKNIEKVEIGNKKINYHNHLNYFPSNEGPTEFEYQNIRERNTFPVRNQYPEIEDRYYYEKTAYNLDEDIRSQKYLGYDRGKGIQKNVDFNSLFRDFALIQDLLRTKSHQEIFIKCRYLIESFLEKIADMIGIQYRNVQHFLASLTNMNLKRKFIFYDEIIGYTKFLNANLHNVDRFMAHSIYILTKRIINKLESILSRKSNNNFYSEYGEIFH